MQKKNQRNHRDQRAIKNNILPQMTQTNAEIKSAKISEISGKQKDKT